MPYHTNCIKKKKKQRMAPPNTNAYVYSHVCKIEHWIETPYTLQRSSLTRRHTTRPDWNTNK